MDGGPGSTGTVYHRASPGVSKPSKPPPMGGPGMLDPPGPGRPRTPSHGHRQGRRLGGCGLPAPAGWVAVWAGLLVLVLLNIEHLTHRALPQQQPDAWAPEDAFLRDRNVRVDPAPKDFPGDDSSRQLEEQQQQQAAAAAAGAAGGEVAAPVDPAPDFLDEAGVPEQPPAAEDPELGGPAAGDEADPPSAFLDAAVDAPEEEEGAPAPLPAAEEAEEAGEEEEYYEEDEEEEGDAPAEQPPAAGLPGEPHLADGDDAPPEPPPHLHEPWDTSLLEAVQGHARYKGRAEPSSDSFYDKSDDASKMHAVIFSDRGQSMRSALLSLEKNSPRARAGGLVVHLIVNKKDCCRDVGAGLGLEVRLYELAAIERELVEDGVNPVWLWEQSRRHFGEAGDGGPDGSEWTIQPSSFDMGDKHTSPMNIGRFYMSYFRAFADLDKIIFLDDDILVLQDIERVWATALDPEMVLATDCHGSFAWDARCEAGLRTPRHIKNTFALGNTLGAGPIDAEHPVESYTCDPAKPKLPSDRCVPPGFFDKLNDLVAEETGLPRAEVDVLKHVAWNFGMVVFNLRAWREHNWVHTLFDRWMEIEHELKLFPQPTVQYGLGIAYLAWYGRIQCYADDIVVLEDIAWLPSYTVLHQLSGWTIADVKEKAFTLHFNGPHKPWEGRTAVPWIARAYLPYFDETAAAIADPNDPQGVLDNLRATAFWDVREEPGKTLFLAFNVPYGAPGGLFQGDEWFRSLLARHPDVSVLQQRMDMYNFVPTYRYSDVLYTEWVEPVGTLPARAAKWQGCGRYYEDLGVQDPSPLRVGATFNPQHICQWRNFLEFYHKREAICAAPRVRALPPWAFTPSEHADLPENEAINDNIEAYMCQVWKPALDALDPADGDMETAVLAAYLHAVAMDVPGGPRFPCRAKLGAGALGLKFQWKWFQDVVTTEETRRGWQERAGRDWAAEPWLKGFGGATWPGAGAEPPAAAAAALPPLPNVFAALGQVVGARALVFRPSAKALLAEYLADPQDGEGRRARVAAGDFGALEDDLAAVLRGPVRWAERIAHGLAGAGVEALEVDVVECAEDVAACQDRVHRFLGVDPEPAAVYRESLSELSGGDDAAPPPPPDFVLQGLERVAALGPDFLRRTEQLIADRLIPEERAAAGIEQGNVKGNQREGGEQRK